MIFKLLGPLWFSSLFQSGNNKKRSEKLYNTVLEKFINVEPATGRRAREIATKDVNAHNSVLTSDNLKKSKEHYCYLGDDRYGIQRINEYVLKFRLYIP